MNILQQERLIGRKEITAYFSNKWGISTWWGARSCIKINKIPFRRTPSGRPMLIIAEIEEYEKQIIKLLLQ